jgi:EAL and modified HD-GYP domain-containing signal transduction protein
LLSRPEVVEGQALSPSRLTCLQVIEKLCDPDTSAREVERTVQTDAALSYRFLRVAGAGASQGLFRRLSSVRDAVVLLGQRRLRAWLTLMLLDGAQPGSDEMLHIAMTRARMAELMARILDPRLADSAYTVGLLSALQLLLQASLAQIVDSLSLSGELEDALLEQRGILGGVLADVLTWEVGGENFQLRSGTAPADVERCYLQALAWATEVCGVLNVAR